MEADFGAAFRAPATLTPVLTNSQTRMGRDRRTMDSLAAFHSRMGKEAISFSPDERFAMLQRHTAATSAESMRRRLSPSIGFQRSNIRAVHASYMPHLCAAKQEST